MINRVYNALSHDIRDESNKQSILDLNNLKMFAVILFCRETSDNIDMENLRTVDSHLQEIQQLPKLHDTGQVEICQITKFSKLLYVFYILKRTMHI